MTTRQISGFCAVTWTHGDALMNQPKALRLQWLDALLRGLLELLEPLLGFVECHKRCMLLVDGVERTLHRGRAVEGRGSHRDVTADLRPVSPGDRSL